MSLTLPEGWPAGYGRHMLAEVDSTLDEGTRIFEGLQGPTWISAAHQTKARGRRGRPWVSPPGNLSVTLVLPLQDETPERVALRSFVAALALFDAMVALTGRPAPFALKWPNDVLLNGGKLAGILLESILRQNRPVGLMIGIGVNLEAAPPVEAVEPGAVRPVSLMGELSTIVTPEEALTELARAYARLETQFRSEGFAPIRAAWLDRATRLGEQITARLPAATLMGRFETVDENGRLVLACDDGRHAVAAADIFF